MNGTDASALLQTLLLLAKATNTPTYVPAREQKAGENSGTAVHDSVFVGGSMGSATTTVTFDYV